MQTSLKIGFAQISLAAQKIQVAQILGACSPPGSYGYVLISTTFAVLPLVNSIKINSNLFQSNVILLTSKEFSFHYRL